MQKRKIFLGIFVITTCCSLTALSLNNLTTDELVPYPDGYREWTHVKTAVVEPGNSAFARFGGIHHIYANKEALKGYRTGQFVDGSVIVFDVLHAVDTNKLLLEGRRKQIDVMVKDSKRYNKTGGWGFEEFSGDSKVNRTDQTAIITECYSCHSKKPRLVFSEWRQ